MAVAQTQSGQLAQVLGIPDLTGSSEWAQDWWWRTYYPEAYAQMMQDEQNRQIILGRAADDAANSMTYQQLTDAMYGTGTTQYPSGYTPGAPWPSQSPTMIGEPGYSQSYQAQVTDTARMTAGDDTEQYANTPNATIGSRFADLEALANQTTAQGDAARAELARLKADQAQQQQQGGNLAQQQPRFYPSMPQYQPQTYFNPNQVYGGNFGTPQYFGPTISGSPASTIGLTGDAQQSQYLADTIALNNARQALSALENDRYSNATGKGQKIADLKSQIAALEGRLGMTSGGRQVQYDTTPAYQQKYIPDNVLATAAAAQNAGVPLSKIQWENVAPGSTTVTADYARAGQQGGPGSSATAGGTGGVDGAPLSAGNAQTQSVGGGTGVSATAAQQVSQANQQRAAQENQLAQDAINRYQQEADAAKAANEERYNQLLGLYGSLRERGLDMVSGLGDQQRREIGEMYDKQRARSEQDLVNRGLSNTTVRESAQRGFTTDQQKALSDLEEQLLRLRYGVDESGVDRIGGVIERRNDTGPQTAELIALLQQFFGAGGGSTATTPSQVGNTGTLQNPSGGQQPTGGYNPNAPTSPTQGSGTTPNPYYPGGTSNLPQGTPQPTGGYVNPNPGAYPSGGQQGPVYQTLPAYPSGQQGTGGQASGGMNGQVPTITTLPDVQGGQTNRGQAQAPRMDWTQPAGGATPDWGNVRGSVVGTDYSNATLAPWHPQYGQQTQQQAAIGVGTGSASGLNQNSQNVINNLIGGQAATPASQPQATSQEVQLKIPTADSKTAQSGSTAQIPQGGFLNPNADYGAGVGKYPVYGTIRR